MTDSEAREMARGLVRGSIIEDAASQFIAQVLKEAHDSRIKPLRDRIEELEAKHQETFQMYVDANEARIDAEEKLQDQTHLIGQLFVMLDKIEQTDDGRIFHPNQLRSCRVADTEKLNEILAELKGGNDDRRRTDPHVSE